MKRTILLLSCLLLVACNNSVNISSESFSSSDSTPTSESFSSIESSEIVSSELSSESLSSIESSEESLLPLYERRLAGYNTEDYLMDEFDLLGTYGNNFELTIYSPVGENNIRTDVFSITQLRNVTNNKFAVYTFLSLSIYNDHLFSVTYKYPSGIEGHYYSGRILYFGNQCSYKLLANSEEMPEIISTWDPNFDYNLYKISGYVPWEVNYGFSENEVGIEPYYNYAKEDYIEVFGYGAGSMSFKFWHFGMRMNIEGNYFNVKYQVHKNEDAIRYDYTLDLETGAFFRLKIYQYPYFYK